MPTYDYKCSSCGHTFEAFQKMTDEPLSECPECKGEVKRLIGAGLSPIFKGSGFYQTDYKKDNSKSSKKEESSKNTENVNSSKSDSNKSESKKEITTKAS